MKIVEFVEQRDLETAIYDPAQDELNKRHIDDTRKTKLTLGDLNRLNKVRAFRKIEALKRMIAYCRSVPARWSDYDRLAKTTAGGWGAHAAVLDIDIGPLLQVQKLANSVHFARAKGYTAPLSAAELELMNLTGDGNGIDMVMMPGELRARVPTANFFQPHGYWRNPIAHRTGVVANLIAEIGSTMQREALSQGARDLAAAF